MLKLCNADKGPIPQVRLLSLAMQWHWFSTVETSVAVRATSLPLVANAVCAVAHPRSTQECQFEYFQVIQQLNHLRIVIMG
jgi:hypothetical protein